MKDLLDCRDLRLEGRVARVDYVEEDIRLLKLVEGCPEGGDELLRQVADETDRVGDDRFGVAGEAEARALRVERCEEAILGEDVAFC